MLAGVGEDGDCPCGSGRAFGACCGLLILRDQLPATAEALMRSRYCAYVQINSRYLRESWHPSTRPAELLFDHFPAALWLGLKILSASAGGDTDLQGEVEFVARYKLGGKAFRLHEVSRFVKEDGRWFYLAGNILPR